MWKLEWLVLAVSLYFASGQEQFLREVTNPTGPSQIILRGGFLGNSATPDEVQVVQPGQQQELEQPQPVELSDPPQQQQALALQAPQDQPIPDDGNNEFTNGAGGFGLRLSQAPPQRQIVQQPRQQQQPQPVQQQTPDVTQSQPPPQQSPLFLPQLPAGQQYVDFYGRPYVLLDQPQAPQPAAPQPTAPPATPPPVPVQKQALVDQYGRTLTEIETQVPQVVQQQQLLQPAPVPLVQHQLVQPAPVQVVQQQQVLAPAAVPVAQQVLQPAALVQNVIQPATVLHKAPPPLTLQTFAVPAIRKVGNLAIPYAQQVTVAKTAKDGVVFPPTVAAAAIVKSKHRTVFSPVKVVAPVSAPAVVHQEVHQPVLVQHAPQQVVLQQPQVAVAHAPQQLVQVQHHQPVAVAHPPQQLLEVHHPPQQLVDVHHSPQQLLEVHHPPQQLVEVHHPPQQVLQVAHHPVAVAHPPQQLVQVAHPPVLEVQHHQPAVVVKKIKQVAKVIPEYTLIHQPVLSKTLFQKHIFNVKHGSEPLIYQDLCTVYPYQKNLRSCVLKKAVLPELHHPDIRTVNVEEQESRLKTDQSIIAGGSSIVVPVPATEAPTPPVMVVAVSKMLPQNIQETIKREKTKAIAAAKEEATAAAASASSQPDAAETRDSQSSRKSRRERRKPKTSSKPRRNNEDDGEFKLV